MAFRLALDICAEANKSKAAGEFQWAGLVSGMLVTVTKEFGTTSPRFTLLVSFLVELAVAHAHTEIYQTDTPPIVLSLAALHLALHAFGVPPLQCIKKLAAVKEEVMLAEKAHKSLLPMVYALAKLWEQAPADSRVIKKWKGREDAIGGPFPPVPKELPPGIMDADEFLTPSPRRSRPSMESLPSRQKSRQLQHEEPALKTSLPAVPDSWKESGKPSKSEATSPVHEFDKPMKPVPELPKLQSDMIQDAPEKSTATSAFDGQAQSAAITDTVGCLPGADMSGFSTGGKQLKRLRQKKCALDVASGEFLSCGETKMRRIEEMTVF